MFDYLIGHALKNVWCTPRQDMQVIFAPARLTKPGGAITATIHLWSRLELPTNGTYYHLFQIGQLTPHLIGLLPYTKEWKRFSDVMHETNLIADIYINNGRHFARSKCFYMWSEERNLIVAIEEQPRIGDLRIEQPYIRLYSNSYFDSIRSDDFPHEITCMNQTMSTVQDGFDFRSLFAGYRDRRGYTWLYVDGVYVDNFTPSVDMVGAQLEFVYDSTVKAVYDFPIPQTPTFDSVLDQKRKYLLHYQSAQVGGFPSIDYQDDVDVYLIRKYQRGPTPDAFEGVYYHKNKSDAMRMLTHRDYSIVVPYVVNYQQQFQGWSNISDLTIRTFVRYSGYERPLVNEHGHIKELYKLPAADVIGAMWGTASDVGVWQAPTLETSNYTAIMRSQETAITPLMVQRAYGYNAISVLMADTPQSVETVYGRRQVSLPPGLQLNATIYEYDASGFLIDFYYHRNGAEYIPHNATCTMIEGISGRGWETMPAIFDQQIVTIEPEVDHRFYYAEKVGGVVHHETWADATGDNTKYIVVGNQVSWVINSNDYATAIKSNKDFLAYRLQLSPQNGLLQFSVSADSYLVNIPPGKLDIWLNGKALIENLDYRVRWPQVIITNKEFLVAGNTQDITVRATGFCKSDLTREEPAERGFVTYGQLSRNGYFNLRDDRVVRFIVKGSTYTRSQLSFVEDTGSVLLPDTMNGFPYLIENVVVPMQGLQDGYDTYSFRQLSLDVDQQVADYLNVRMPEPVEPNPNPSLERYMIYSPFCSTVIHDLVNGVISMDSFQGHISDRDVIERLEEYRWLLDYDPTQFPLESQYVSVHPHNLLTEIHLDIYQWRFISRAVKTFLENKVDLSRFVVVD